MARVTSGLRGTAAGRYSSWPMRRFDASEVEFHQGALFVVAHVVVDILLR